MAQPGGRMTRRAFLKAGTALAAAPYVLSSLAFGRSAKPAPSDRVTVGILGCGRSGGYWAQGYYRLRQFQIASVCDVEAEHRQRLCSRIERRQKGTKSVLDFREVLADESIDAVVIATPDHWHAVMACAAARANKDIYCESPISLTVREARQIARVTTRYGRIFQAGLSHRYYTSYRKAISLIRAGVLGKIRQIYAPCGNPSQYCTLGAIHTPCPASLDWDLWLGPAPLAPYNPRRCSYSYEGWRSFREYSGGPLASQGAASFDVAQWALGDDAPGPIEFVPPKEQGDTTVPLTIRYADGTVILNARGPHKGSVEFVGEKGSLALGVGESGFTTWQDNLATASAPAIGPQRKFSSDLVTDFRDCVRTRTRPLANVALAARAVTVAHLACIATWTGRTVKWDPAGEKIVGDEYAARLLDRPKRSPWRC